ncbi:MAG: hypothetical protein U0637_12440 [Phycisphaerales bacterium]
MSEEQPPTAPKPKDAPQREVFELAPEVQTPRTQAPPVPAAPPPSQVEVVDTHQDDADDEQREMPPLHEPLVSDKLVSWRRWGAVGAGLTLAGAYLAFRNEPRFSLLHALMVLYYAPLLTLLGVGAGFGMATLEGRRVGGKDGWRELAARLLTCVAAGLALAAIDFPLVGRAGGSVLGACAYFGLLMALMGWPAARAARLASVHFVLAVLIYIPVAVARWMAEK